LTAMSNPGCAARTASSRATTAGAARASTPAR
jgi:hypothetical protein